LRFSLLASGSKANCLYVSSGETQVLVDCGLSARETFKRLSSLSIDPVKLTAIVISHEHEDHVAGVRVLAKTLGIPIFTHEAAVLKSKHFAGISLHQLYFFETNCSFRIGSLKFFPIPVSHDAASPVAFRIQDDSSQLCVLTDLGHYDDEVLRLCAGSDALILETNHEEEVLWTSSYPWEVKHRIASGKGHLSNITASNFLHSLCRQDLELGDIRLKVIGGAHVSDVSNTPDRALQALKSGWLSSKAQTPHFFVGSAKECSELYTL